MAGEWRATNLARGEERSLFGILRRLWTGLICVGGMLAMGCGGTPEKPTISVAETLPGPRPPVHLLKLRMEFHSVAAAKESKELLKSTLKELATIENGPFVLGGQPFVHLAVSAAPQAPVEPILKKLREVRGVKNVTVLR